MLSKLILFLVLAALLISGCGKKEETPGTENKQNVTENTQGLDQTKEQKLGENPLNIKEGLPSDFPSDVPQPPNSQVLGNMSSAEGTVVTYKSTDKPMDILAFYNAELGKNGYTKNEGEMMSEKGGFTAWKKDTKEISLMLVKEDTGNNCSVVLTYNLKK
jgi:hypothetical protein